MKKNGARENSRYQPTQPAENLLDVAAESDNDTEVGSTIFTPATTEVGDSIADLSDGARAHTQGKRFTSNDKKTMTEAKIAAMVRLKCSFMALDNIIELYDSFESRFKDDLLSWNRTQHKYLGEISEAVRAIVADTGPMTQSFPSKGWLHDAAIILRAVFNERWSVESHKRLNRQTLEMNTLGSATSGKTYQGTPSTANPTSPVVDAVDPVQLGQYPPNMGPPPRSMGKAVWDKYWRDLDNENVVGWKYAEDFPSGSEKMAQKEKDWRPAVRTQAKLNRQHVRDMLVDPLRMAIDGWKEEGNRDIEDMKQILWGD